MKFIDLDKQHIIEYSKLESEFYIYEVGQAVEVTSIKSVHKNSLIMDNIAADKKDDRLMVQYVPNNKVFFSRALIESDSDFVSCKIDESRATLYVGTQAEYGKATGVLVFSGYLSANALVEEERPILCNKKFKDTLLERVRLLSVGMRGDKLYGLFFVPSARGIAISNGSFEVGLSSTTYKEVKCTSYFSYNIDSWFESAKIRGCANVTRN